MKKCIAKNKLKSVYLDDDKTMKVFALSYSKTDVLYEALNTARVEDTGLNIPKILSVFVDDAGCWVITKEYAQGITLTEALKEFPERTDEYIEAMVDYQIEFNKRSNPLLLSLKEKLARQINEIDIKNHIKYELSTRLESLPTHNKLCHGDYCPDNIIVKLTKTGKITRITAIDWVHATKGNASADVANTYLILKLTDEEMAQKYINSFCKKTKTSLKYVNKWMPIVAASRLCRKNPVEKEMLLEMIDICDFQ